MPDRLREHEQVVAAGAGQVVVARQRKDRRSRRIGLDVVGDGNARRGAVGLVQVTNMSRTNAPAKLAGVVTVSDPTSSSAPSRYRRRAAFRRSGSSRKADFDRYRSEPSIVGGQFRQAEINWLSGNAGWELFSEASAQISSYIGIAANCYADISIAIRRSCKRRCVSGTRTAEIADAAPCRCDVGLSETGHHLIESEGNGRCVADTVRYGVGARR